MDTFNDPNKNRFVILFGGSNTEKSKDLPEIIERSYKNSKKAINSLKISLMYQNKEIVIKDIQFDIKTKDIKRHIQNAQF